MNIEDIGYSGDFVHKLKIHLNSKKLSKCYILIGPQSRNKLCLALSIAKFVNCSSDIPENCNGCKNCQLITNHTHPDVQVYTSTKTDFGIDLVKKIQTDSSQTNYKAKYRVNIIENAHKMTIPAQNAILKTLEDSVSDSITIMLAETTSSILDTITSRSIILNLPPLTREKTVSIIVEKGLGRDRAESEYNESSGDIEWLIWTLDNREKCDDILSTITKEKNERTVAVIESISNTDNHEGFRYLLPKIVSKAILLKNGIDVQSDILLTAVTVLASEDEKILDAIRIEIQKAEKLWNTRIQKTTLLQKTLMPLMI